MNPIYAIAKEVDLLYYILKFIDSVNRDYELSINNNGCSSWVEIEFYIDYISMPSEDGVKQFRLTVDCEEFSDIDDIHYWECIFDLHNMKYDKDKIYKELNERGWLHYV